MIYLMASFFCVGILFGNLNSTAMEPLGQIAGVGAAVVGSLSLLIAVSLGMLVGQSYNGTVLPLVAGFLVLSSLSVFVMRWAEVRKHVPSTYGRKYLYGLCRCCRHIWRCSCTEWPCDYKSHPGVWLFEKGT